MGKTVLIGHATSDERGKSSGGKAGDQNGNEVFTRNWYKRSKGWATVFRAKDPEVAEKIAATMEAACANDKIGYDQGQRTTLYFQAKSVDWDLSKIKTACETDCSALVAVCVCAAGIDVPKNMYTGDERETLKKTKAFTLLEDEKYLLKCDYLARGDILLGNGHTAVVLSDGELYTLEKKKTEASAFVAFKVKVTADALNVRAGAGTKYKINTVVHKNEIYTIVGQDGKWGKLKSGAGWISLDYTKRV